MNPEFVYQVCRQSDMTEGRGPLRPDNEVWLNEQDAWDSINDRGGVMGSHPARNTCYPVDRCKELGITNWQQYKERLNMDGDYTVRKVRVR